jgi:hypothetical protein
MVSATNLQESIQRLGAKEGHVIDARLWAIAFGYSTCGKTTTTLNNFLPQNFDRQMLYFTSAVFLTSAVVTAGLVKAFSTR